MCTRYKRLKAAFASEHDLSAKHHGALVGVTKHPASFLVPHWARRRASTRRLIRSRLDQCQAGILVGAIGLRHRSSAKVAITTIV